MVESQTLARYHRGRRNTPRMHYSRPMAAAGSAPWDRSPGNGQALVTAGQAAQVPYHLNRAMDNGLTQTQASEVLTQLALGGLVNISRHYPYLKRYLQAKPRPDG